MAIDQVLDEVSWSDWVSLLPTQDLNCIPDEPGLCRVAHSKTSGIHYIGHADEDLRQRARRLGYEMKKDEMPFRDPHTAAPCLWAMKDDIGGRYFISWLSGAEEPPLRVLKAAYIFQCRLILGQSPTANFGRMYSGYSQSSNRESGIQGERDPGLIRDRIIGCPERPLENWHDVTADEWLGISWSSPRPFKSDRFGGLSYVFPEQEGVFRVWKEGENA